MCWKWDMLRVASTKPLRTAVAAIKASGSAVPQSRAISPPSFATTPSTYAIRKRLRRRLTFAACFACRVLWASVDLGDSDH